MKAIPISTTTTIMFKNSPAYYISPTITSESNESSFQPDFVASHVVATSRARPMCLAVIVWYNGEMHLTILRIEMRESLLDYSIVGGYCEGRSRCIYFQDAHKAAYLNMYNTATRTCTIRKMPLNKLLIRGRTIVGPGKKSISGGVVANRCADRNVAVDGSPISNRRGSRHSIETGINGLNLGRSS